MPVNDHDNPTATRMQFDRLIADSLTQATMWTASFTAAGVTLAYCIAPLVRFAPLATLSLGGGLLAFAILFLVPGLFTAIRQPWPVTRVLGTACMLVGVPVTIGALVQAARSAHANDERCLAIQRDMLSARPRRTDGPDLFQALDCRAQGEGSVFAVPRRSH